MERMSILDNYYGEGKSIREKIDELEEENKKLKEVHNLTIESKDFFINKLIEERDYWEGKYRELDKLVMQKIGVKLD